MSTFDAPDDSFKLIHICSPLLSNFWQSIITCCCWMFAWPFHSGFTPTFQLISHPPIFRHSANRRLCSVLTWTSTPGQHCHCQNKQFRQGKAANSMFFSLNGFLRIQMSKTSVYLLAATDTVESPIQRDDITDVCQHAEFSEAIVQMFCYSGNSSNCSWNKLPIYPINYSFCSLAPPHLPTSVPQLPSFPPASPISF